MNSRMRFVKSVWDDMLARGGTESHLIPNLCVSQAQRNFVRAELVVDHRHLNRLGSVHGGVVSTLVDVGGSLAVASRGMFMTGVTTDLATTYMSLVGRCGDSLRIDCHLNKMGRSMAYTYVEVFRRHADEFHLVARGNHTKHIQQALRSEFNVPGFEDD